MSKEKQTSLKNRDNPPTQTYSEQQSRKDLLLSTAAVAGRTAAGLTLGFSVGMGAMYNAAPVLIDPRPPAKAVGYKPSSEPALALVSENCMVVPDDVLEKTKALVLDPSSMHHQSYVESLPDEMLQYASIYEIQRTYQHQLAVELGLTLPDVDDPLNRLFHQGAAGEYMAEPPTRTIFAGGELYRGPDQLPMQRVIEVAQKVLDEYGVKLYVGEALPDSTDAQDFELMEYGRLERETLKRNIAYTVLAISKYPREYIEMVDLDEIRFVTFADPNVAATASKPYHNSLATMSVDAFGGYSAEDIESLTAHELNHFLDRRLCAVNTDDDPAFTGLNPLPPDKFYQFENKDFAYPEVKTLSQQHQTSKALQDIENVVVSRPYSFKDPGEDKADAVASSRDVSSTDFTVELFESGSVLGKKMNLLGARLHELDESGDQILRYFVESDKFERLLLKERQNRFDGIAKHGSSTGSSGR